MLLLYYHNFRPRKHDNVQNVNDETSNRYRLLLRDYTDAEDQGKTKGECLKHYGMCPFSIRSMLPKVLKAYWFQSRNIKVHFLLQQGVSKIYNPNFWMHFIISGIRLPAY